MNLAELAFLELYPKKELKHNISLKYSGKFKSYNANVRMRTNHIHLNLSKKWKHISKDIQIGLIQSLLIKLLKDKKHTTNIDLYEIFMKKLHISIPKTKTDPILEESFNRVNESYFYDLIEKPNLCWGSNSYSKLGSYEYGTDTITISSALRELPLEILDYIMYHEMLHKKHKFYTKNCKSYHHTREFKKKEKEYNNREEIEKELKKILRSKRRRTFFKGFLT